MKKHNPFYTISVLLKLVLLALLVLGAGVLNLRAGDIIGFNISSPKYNNLMTAGDYAGAPGAHTNNWNNLLATADGAAAAISLAAGSISNSAGDIVSDMEVTFQPGRSGGGVYNRGSGSFTNDSRMYIDINDTYNCSGFSQFGYLDITNIPYANYSIYCYFRPDNGSGSSNTRGGFWLITNTPSGFQRYYIQNQSNDVAQTQEPDPATSGSGPSSVGLNYVQSFTTAIPSGGAAWNSIQGGNYAVFTGLTNSYTRIWFGGLGNGSGGKDDLGNYVNGGSGAVRFKVAGFQIVQTTPGTVTNIYLASTNVNLHAGNPSGTPVTVLGDEDNGTLGVNLTSASAFASDNTAVFTVSATGVLQAGADGTANLIVSYTNALNNILSITNPVVVLGPASVSISVAGTNLLVGNGQGDKTTATLYATYSDATNVVVNNFGFVSFSTSTPGVITVTSNGVITAVGSGSFSITGTYDGLSATANNAGAVTAFTAPTGSPAFGVKLTDSSHAMTFHDLSGAPGVRNAYWNNDVLNAAANTVTALNSVVDNQGNSLAGTAVQVMTGNLQDSTINTIGAPGTNESTLFDTYYDSGMNNGITESSTLVVSNVPYSSYDAYFYFYNDNSTSGANRPGQVTIDGVTQYRINNPSAASQADNSGNGYVVASPQPSGLPASVADVPWGNVIKFTGLTDSTLTAAWAGVGQDYIGDAASVTRVRLVGFQLVKSLGGLTATNVYLSSPVPNQLAGNPATYPLIVLADFTDGTKAGNITSLSGITFSSSDTNVFLVDANGNITPGLTPGNATLTVTYQANTLDVGITNLAPTSVAVRAAPGTVYLDGNLGLMNSQASAYANFPGYNNVNISGFNSITYVDQGSTVCSLDVNGAISPNGVDGSANLGVSYLGTTYVSTNAFSVRSIGDSPVLKHLYFFTNAPDSGVVVDMIGGANGTVYGPLGTNSPITFDGSRVIFPGDGNYTDEPYISLQPGIINQLGDVTIAMWGGQSQLNAWARFLGFGTTGKGLTPYANAASISYLQLLAAYAGSGHASFFTPGHGADAQTSFSLTNGAEYYLVAVYAPNAGTVAFYVNGNLIGSGTPVSSPLSTSVNDTVDWLGVSLDNNDPPLAGWMNKLAIYEGVLSADQVASNYNAGVSVYLPPATVSTVPTNIVVNISGSTLTLSWPADHLGWKLQVQTNSLGNGLGSNWITVPGSDAVTSTNITINPAYGSVFYRLMY